MEKMDIDVITFIKSLFLQYVNIPLEIKKDIIILLLSKTMFLIKKAYMCRLQHGDTHLNNFMIYNDENTLDYLNNLYTNENYLNNLKDVIKEKYLDFIKDFKNLNRKQLKQHIKNNFHNKLNERELFIYNLLRYKHQSEKNDNFYIDFTDYIDDLNIKIIDIDDIGYIINIDSMKFIDFGASKKISDCNINEILNVKNKNKIEEIFKFDMEFGKLKELMPEINFFI
jgi:hypothetical protein